MKTYMIRLVLSVVALLSASMTRAFDFFALNEDDVLIYYSILSSLERTCGVSRDPSGYSGAIRIPERVSYNSVEFTVVKIDNSAFYSCPDLTSVEIPETVTSIGSYAFLGTGLNSITIPSGVSIINIGAFTNCINLASITIPDGVTSIGVGAFRSCTNLTSMTIPDNVTSIGQYAFQGCTNLTSMTIPDNVTSIGQYAFSDCTGLTSVTIGKSVQTMENYAFDGCNALKEVTSRIENPFAISSHCFPEKVRNSALLKVPKGTLAKYQSTRYWMTFSNIIEESTAYRSLKLSDDLQLFSYSENLDFSGCQSQKVYTVCGFKPETSEVIMMPVTNVPAGTGVLIKGGTETFYPIVCDQSSSFYSNLLVGSLTATSLTDGYVLKGDCFERVDVPTTIAANSAYLTLPASAQGVKRLTLKFMEESTDIDLVKDEMPQGNSHWYNLQGTRLNGTPTTPGIYIRNGRKVWVK